MSLNNTKIVSKNNILIYLISLILLIIFALIVSYPKLTVLIQKKHYLSHNIKKLGFSDLGQVYANGTGEFSTRGSDDQGINLKSVFSSHRSESDNSKKSLIGLPDQSFGSIRSGGDSEKTRALTQNTLFPQVKIWCLAFLNQNISFPESSMVFSMVFGGTQLISSEFRHYFKVTGMLHVAAASGANISMVGQLAAVGLSRFLGRRQAALGLLLSIFIYIGTAGLSSTLIRAGLMSSLSILAGWVSYRSFRPLWGWVTTGVVMIGLSPELVTEVSFQLSMSATLGILIFGNRWLKDGGLLTALETNNLAPLPSLAQAGWLKAVAAMFYEGAVLNVAAQVFTLPLLLHHFGELAALSLVANVILGWLTPLITFSALILIGLGGLLESMPQLDFITHLVGLVPASITSLFITGLTLLGQTGWGLWKIEGFSALHIWLWWGMVAVLGWKTRPSRVRPVFFFEKNEVSQA